MKDGGPALPAKAYSHAEYGIDGEARPVYGYHSGMSLRDWFAGMAMQALINNEAHSHLAWDGIAENALGYAYAMLKAREVGDDK
jgi:hypothetical protein